MQSAVCQADCNKKMSQNSNQNREAVTQATCKSVNKILSKLSRIRDHDIRTKTTGILQPVQKKRQATSVRVCVTAGDTERLPRQCSLVPSITSTPSTPPMLPQPKSDNPSGRSPSSHPCIHQPLITNFVHPSRASGSISCSGQFRQRAQPIFR